MIVYLIITGILGIIGFVIGIGMMIANYEYGTDDDDFRVGAVTAVLSLFAPLTIPLVLIGSAGYAIHIVYRIIKEMLKSDD